jgi:conjugative transfer signal peptidase TraF
MKGYRDRTSDRPLLAWGDALRATRMHRLRLRKKVAITGAGIAILLGSAALPPAPRFVWNASASAPIGLYAVTPGASVEPGDMVIARLPAPYRQLAAERHYLPINVPLVKRVAANAGDEVCALGQEIFINGRWVADRHIADGKGRPMPMWDGCLRLHGGQVFLLMDNPASFDGRYFGITEGADVIGKARLLWRR